MVATRSTYQDVIDFVTGKERIEPKTIQVEEWIQILRVAAEELPINYMRGLKSLKQILQYDGSYGVERVVKGALPPLWPVLTGRIQRNPIRPNAVFLACAEAGEDFPQGKWAHESYPKAPRADGKLGPNTGDLLPINTEHFLLSRDRKFYYLSAKWLPREEWDERSMSSTPARFWYQLNLSSLVLKEMDDDPKFEGLLAAAHERNLPQTMLQRFNMALIETAGDMRGQYDHIMEKKQIIGGYLDRIGELIH